MAWLDGWSYRKPVTLSRASGAVTNYQMKLLLGESSGATGEDVDCGGLCLSNFNDIRFTAADGTTLLDYWIESITGTTPNQLATVWIEFNSIGTGATTFYLYYGKADATAASNGANTFSVFDDFERGSNNDAVGGAWSAIKGTMVISTAQVFQGSRSGRLVSDAIYTLPITAGANISVMFRARKSDTGGMTLAHGDASTVCYMKWDTDEKLYYYNGSAWVDSGSTHTADAWHLFELNAFNYSANTNDIWVDGTKCVTGAAQFAFAGSANKIYVEGRVSGQDQYVDCLIVRDYLETEPTWGNWGSEEAGGGYTLATDPGAYSVVGTSLDLKATRKLVITSGSVAVTGSSVGLKKGFRIDAAPGAFALTGTDVDLTLGLESTYTLEVGSGAFTTTGQPVNLKASRKISVESGTLALSGQPLSLIWGRGMQLLSGAFVTSGSEVALRRYAKLLIGSGVITVNGTGITMTLTRRQDSISWENQMFAGSKVRTVIAVQKDRTSAAATSRVTGI